MGKIYIGKPCGTKTRKGAPRLDQAPIPPVTCARQRRPAGEPAPSAALIEREFRAPRVVRRPASLNWDWARRRIDVLEAQPVALSSRPRGGAMRWRTLEASVRTVRTLKEGVLVVGTASTGSSGSGGLRW